MKRKSREYHGLTNTQIYKKWTNIKERCNNVNYYRYSDYGGRGIKMCDEWCYNFQSFYDYMTSLSSYNEHLANNKLITIDRIDNNKGYEPGNIRWTDYHVQLANRRPVKNKLKYTGVYELRNKYKGKQYPLKYYSVINVNRSAIFLGVYNTVKEAVVARDQYIISNKLFEYPLQVLTSL